MHWDQNSIYWYFKVIYKRISEKSVKTQITVIIFERCINYKKNPSLKQN